MAARLPVVIGASGRVQQAQSADSLVLPLVTGLTIFDGNGRFNAGVTLADGGLIHGLRLSFTETLTAERTLTFVVGNANRTVSLSGDLTVSSAATVSGTNTGDQTSVTGNAGTATALQTGRTIAITGDLTYTSPSFDGSSNVTAAATFPAGRFRGYIDGLVTSRASTTTVTVAAGTARDSTDAYFLYLSAATTKTLQASGAWAAGTGNNGLDTGARANSTWYHVWAISQAAGASPDVLFSTSATAPTMPSGYTLKRRIGSVKTDGSGNILLYRQYGDKFLWDAVVVDVNVLNPGTTAVTRTLTVPTGVVVEAHVGVIGYGTAATDPPAAVYLSELAATDNAAAAGNFNPLYVYNVAGIQVGSVGTVWTNTSGQIRSRCQASTAATGLYINTLGWTDPRGKNE